RPGSTTMKGALATPTIDLDALGFDRGAGLLLERALARISPGSRLQVVGRDPALTVDLAPWCRSRGHRVEAGNVVVKGDADAARQLPPEIEAAVVQVMTYLVENEQAALVVPARFVGRVHPHFREVVQLLAVQVADEARHVEVFARRAALRGGPLGVSTTGGRASLQTLLDEPDFSLASFLLSVLGEGTFLNLLSFIETYAPDTVTRHVAHLALQGES